VTQFDWLASQTEGALDDTAAPDETLNDAADKLSSERPQGPPAAENQPASGAEPIEGPSAPEDHVAQEPSKQERSWWPFGKKKSTPKIEDKSRAAPATSVNQHPEEAPTPSADEPAKGSGDPDIDLPPAADANQSESPPQAAGRDKDDDDDALNEFLKGIR
jgi:hypothetical protein